MLSAVDISTPSDSPEVNKANLEHKTIVYMSVPMVHDNQIVFLEPEKFILERWI